MKQRIFSQVSGKRSTAITAAVIAFAIMTASLLAPGKAAAAVKTNKEGKEAREAGLDLKEGKEYHAYMLFQVQNSWVYRGKFWEEDKGPGNENWDKLLTSLNVTTPVVVDGSVEDAVIKGNGHYTVKLSGLNGSPTAGADNAEFGILGFSTDIPKNDTIKFDNIHVTIDGIDKGTVSGDDVYYDKDDIEDPGLITVEVFNAWHEECKNLSLTLPNDTVEISFDVSGFEYDNPDAVKQTDDSSLQKDTDKDSGNAAADKQETNDNKETKNNRDSGNANRYLYIGIALFIIIIVAGIFVWMKKKKNP